MTELKPTLKLAIGQMCSAASHAPNIAVMEQLVQEATASGAELLCLPEVAGLMNRDGKAAAEMVGPAEVDPYLAAARNAAQQAGIWLHPGSTPVLGPDGRFLNHSVLIDPEGREVAAYDKIHLFDVALEGQAPIGESKRFAPGDRAVLVHTPWGPWGMSICYDLRFAHLYHSYGQLGARVMFIPAAFTVPTGRAHWEVLLRARAIETGAFVVAAAQAGQHEDGRETWGHSLVISPWGEVLADLGPDAAPSCAILELDLTEVERARAQIPNLKNGRDFHLVEITA